MKHDATLSGLNGVGGKGALMRARAAFADLAAQAADPAEARRIATELNDAYLRLQFALVIADPRLIRTQRDAWRARLVEARAVARAAEEVEAVPAAA